jgi:hypothetical protein
MAKRQFNSVHEAFMFIVEVITNEPIVFIKFVAFVRDIDKRQYETSAIGVALFRFGESIHQMAEIMKHTKEENNDTV